MLELERSYRRLLRAYPRFYRRERELEMLSTLLDAAGPGQVRPSRGEAAHLLWMGLRCRFVPSTWVGRIAAGFVAVWAAVVLSGVGAFAVWGFADPDVPDLAALSDELVGQQPSYTYELPDDDLLGMGFAYKTYGGEFQTFATEGWDGERPAPMGQNRIYEQVDRTPAVLTEAYRHLSGTGWRTGAPIPGGAGQDGAFWASRDGVLLRVSGYDNQSGVTVSAYPVEPRGVLAGAIIGSVAGLVVVLPVMTWLTYRSIRAPLRVRRLILLLGSPAVIAGAVNTLDNVLSMVPDPDTASVLFAADYMYPLGNQIANPLAAVVITCALAGCVGLVAPRAQTNGLAPVNAATPTSEAD